MENGGKPTIFLASKYDRLSVPGVTAQQMRLSEEQCASLEKMFWTVMSSSMDDCSSSYKGAKLHINLKSGACSVQCQPFPVPHVHAETFKKELQHLCNQGILE